MANFLKKYFVGKNRRGWRRNTEVLLKNGTKYGYVYLPCYCRGRIYIALGPWHLGDFRIIFLPSIGEDQKNLTISARGP